MTTCLRCDFLCSDPNHPIVPRLKQWCEKMAGKDGLIVRLCHSLEECQGGDVLFLISCSVFVGRSIRNLYTNTLVLHAADLPKGRGWSPHIWTILSGENRVVVSLLDAAGSIDSGDVWAKREIAFNGTEVYDEINSRLFDTEIELIEFFIKSKSSMRPVAQQGDATYWRRRTPEDSRLDPEKTLAEQFDLLRVCDPDRYPAFLDFRGRRFNVILRPVEQPED